MCLLIFHKWCSLLLPTQQKQYHLLCLIEWNCFKCKGTHRWALLIISFNHLIIINDTFTLFWSRKTSLIVEMFQLSFHVFTFAFHPEISSFFRRFLFHFYLICYPYFSTFHSKWLYGHLPYLFILSAISHFEIVLVLVMHFNLVGMLILF